jgi:hypothetical protein
MMKTLHECFAAVLLCGAVGLAGPAFAADQHKATTHHAVSTKHKMTARQKGHEAQLDRQEHAITARLNRDSLTKQPSANAAITATAEQPMDEEYTQQAFLEDDE